jgi:hypothetical protein
MAGQRSGIRTRKRTAEPRPRTLLYISDLRMPSPCSPFGIPIALREGPNAQTSLLRDSSKGLQQRSAMR